MLLAVLTFLLFLQSNTLKFYKTIGTAQNMELEREYVFQQNNDPKHKAKITKKFLEDNDITILDWPPQIPSSTYGII